MIKHKHSLHLIIYLIIAVCGLCLKAAYFESFDFSMYTDRDFSRAYDFFRNFQTSGSEFTDGGRTPGWGYYAVVKILLLLSNNSLWGVYWLTQLLYALAVFGIFKLIRTYVGTIAGSFVALILMCSNTYLEVTNNLINPTYGYIFGLYSMFLMSKIVLEKKPNLFPLAILMISFAASMHFSFAYYFPLILINILIFKVRLSLRDMVLGLLAVLAMYVPYLIETVRTSPGETLNYFKYNIISYEDSAYYVFKEIVETAWSAYGGFFTLPGEISESFCWIKRVNLFGNRSDWGPFLLLNLLTALPLTVHLVFWKRPRSSFEKFVAANIVITLVFSAITFNMTYLGGNFRRYLFATPFVLMGFASSYDVLLAKISDGSRKKGLFTSAILATVFAYFSIGFYLFYRSNEVKIWTYQLKRDLVNHVGAQNSKYLKNSVALITRNDETLDGSLIVGTRDIANNNYAGLDFFIKSAEVFKKESVGDQENCLVVLHNSKRHNDNLGYIDEIKSLDEFKDVEPISIEVKNRSVFVEYKRSGSNCLSYFKNMYVYDDQENFLLSVKDEIDSNPHAVFMKNSSDGYKFYFKTNLPSGRRLNHPENPGIAEGGNFYLDPVDGIRVLVELEKTGRKYRATIFSNILFPKREAGIEMSYFFWLRDAQIVITNLASNKKVEPHFLDGLAEEVKIRMYPPFRSNDFEIEPGISRIELVVGERKIVLSEGILF